MVSASRRTAAGRRAAGIQPAVGMPRLIYNLKVAIPAEADLDSVSLVARRDARASTVARAAGGSRNLIVNKLSSSGGARGDEPLGAAR